MAIVTSGSMSAFVGDRPSKRKFKLKIGANIMATRGKKKNSMAKGRKSSTRGKKKKR
jgi:hypothetical protein|tara:strand:+ start:731 stop:901 length:171 start_codon:yes stop_codon:yes gene_type:complete